MRVKPYLVRRGDTLSAIAKYHHVSLAALLDENPQITNRHQIRSGESILVPVDSAEPRSIHAVMAEEGNPDDDPLWLKIAFREEGVAEVAGAGNNLRILEYHASTALKKDKARQDSTAWCSSFVNWCMNQAGQQGTNSAWALDWKNWGHTLDAPRRGCVVVFSRRGLVSDGGHVGFYLGESTKTIEVLGGNQGNQVRVSKIPRDGISGAFAYKWKAYRWPSGV